MRSRTALLVGLSTVLLFFSTYSIAFVNGQSFNASNKTNKSSDENSVLQTENLDPFKQKGSDNNDKSNDGSTNNNDNDGSANNNHDDSKKGSDNSKSSEGNKDSKSEHDKKHIELPFP